MLIIHGKYVLSFKALQSTNEAWNLIDIYLIIFIQHLVEY